MKYRLIFFYQLFIVFITILPIQADLLLHHNGESSSLTNANPNQDESIFKSEVGMVDINHNWTRIEFKSSYKNPVIVANLTSGDIRQSGIIRIDKIDARGFSIRLQELKYLAGIQSDATASYMVMESGTYLLEDGKQVEAGIINAPDANRIKRTFEQTFFDRPVVLTSVAMTNGAQPVTGRVDKIDLDGFEYIKQEEKALTDGHIPETIYYIAWEPSKGTINGLRFEVAAIDTGTHEFTSMDFKAEFQTIPMIFAGIQTSEASDTATLRYRNTPTGLEMMLDEEQSRNEETDRAIEKCGFIAIEDTANDDVTDRGDTIRKDSRPDTTAVNGPVHRDGLLPKPVSASSIKNTEIKKTYYPSNPNEYREAVFLFNRYGCGLVGTRTVEFDDIEIENRKVISAKLYVTAWYGAIGGKPFSEGLTKEVNRCRKVYASRDGENHLVHDTETEIDIPPDEFSCDKGKSHYNHEFYFYGDSVLNAYAQLLPARLEITLGDTCKSIDPPPGAPRDLNAKPSSDKINLEWDSVNSADTYNLYWSTQSGVTTSQYTGKIDGLSETSYTHSETTDGVSLDPQQTYYYIITAQNASGVEGAASDEVNAKLLPQLPPPPDTPKDLRATSSAKKITLTWRAAANASQYNLYWSTDSGVSPSQYLGKIAGITGATYIHVEETNGVPLKANRTYYYVVTAQNAAGVESQPSVETHAKTFPIAINSTLSLLLLE